MDVPGRPYQGEAVLVRPVGTNEMPNERLPAFLSALRLLHRAVDHLPVPYPSLQTPRLLVNSCMPAVQ
jgi:hypothetical protein